MTLLHVKHLGEIYGFFPSDSGNFFFFGGGGGWALIFVNVYSLGKEKNFEFETNHYKFSCCQERMLCGHLDCYT